jgi:hypothetical protein
MILGDTSWLRETTISLNNSGSGFPPIEGDSHFIMALFPDENGETASWFEFTLSGMALWVGVRRRRRQ